MERLNEVFLPETEQDAMKMAVQHMLHAASLLMTAADLAPDGAQVDFYINGATRLRDLANSLMPDKPDWPANVIPFMPRSAGLE